METIELDLPPITFKTQGMWFVLSSRIRRLMEDPRFDFPGALHALEHAAIGVLPLMVMADRNDLGGVSTHYHAQAGGAAVFIYDGVPGGVGLSLQAYRNARTLLHNTLKAIRDCPCRDGCPACVHSPKCGSGNRPIDKTGAMIVLRALLEPDPGATHRQASPGGRLREAGDDGLSPSPPPRPISPATVVDRRDEGPPLPAVTRRGGPRAGRLKKRLRRVLAEERKALPARKGTGGSPFGVFDIETQRSAEDVGGWHRADLMRVSCAVVYDSRQEAYSEYFEAQVPQLIAHLERLPLVVGFNSLRFDYRVLSGYRGFDPQRLKTLDILATIHRILGFRLSLNHLARVTLGTRKSADGLKALQWWKEGRLREIADYCRRDVEITRRLFDYGREKGHLLFERREGGVARIPVCW